MAILTLTNFAGRHSLFENGQFIGSAYNNPFGGISVHDAHGMFAGHTETFGNQTNEFGQNGMSIGHTETFGNQTTHFGKNGMIDGYIRPNIQGGHDYFDAHGQLTEHTFATLGNMDNHDITENLSNHDSILDHMTGMIDSLNDHLGS